MSRSLLTLAALALAATSTAEAKPLRLDTSQALPGGCLGWSERARAALCVTHEYSHQGSATWRLTFVGPGAEHLEPLTIAERVGGGHAEPLLRWSDAARVRQLLREWHFDPLDAPRAFLSSGDNMVWAKPPVTLHWQSRVTSKWHDEDGDSGEKREDVITMRCGKAPPRELARWDSSDDQPGSSLRVYLIVSRDRNGSWQKTYVLFERHRHWAVEGDGGGEDIATVVELPRGCEWYGF